MPGVVGPSNIPARSPSTSRRSSRPTSLPSSSSPAFVVPTTLADSARGRRSDRTTSGRVGGPLPRSRCARVAAPRASSSAACSRGESGRRRHAVASVPSRHEAVPCHGHARWRRGALQRVDADRSARCQGERARAERPGERSVLALRIEHRNLSPEGRLPKQVGLHESALPPSDLAEHRDIRIGHGACRVQLERVMGKGAADKVLADEHPARGERRRRGKRVGGAELGRRRLMSRQPHAHPRPVGKVHV